MGIILQQNSGIILQEDGGYLLNEGVNRYWVGGTGNWDATTTHWSNVSGGSGGYSVPGVNDNVFFDSASNATAYTVTVTANSGGQNFSINKPASGVLSINININYTLFVYGNLLVYSLVLFTGPGQIRMNNSVGTKTITTNGVPLVYLTLYSSSGGYQLQDNLTISDTIYLLGGSFDANSKTVTLGTTYFTKYPGEILGDFSGSNSFYNLTLNKGAGFVWNFALSNDLYVTNLFTTTGGDAAKYRTLIKSSVPGTSRTIYAGSVSAINTDFRDITGAGTASWNLSASSGIGNAGGNTNITFTPAVDQHWLNSSSGLWSVSSNWTSRVPLPQDDVFMDKAFGTSQTVTMDVSRMGKNINWTGATWTTSLTWNINNSSFDDGTIYGNLIMISGLTTSGIGVITFSARSGSYNITSNGVTFTQQFYFLYSIGATYTFTDNFISTSDNAGGSILHYSGTVNFPSSIILKGFTSSGSYQRTINLGSSLIQINGDGGWSCSANTNLTFQTTASTIKYTSTSVNSLGFWGGDFTYDTVWFDRGVSSGFIFIYGNNTFGNFKDTGTGSGSGHSIYFAPSSTQTFSNFNVNGNTTNHITLNSTSGTYNLVKTGTGLVNCNYLNIYHSIARPWSGAGGIDTWYAGNNSGNFQSVATAGSGWIFLPAPLFVDKNDSINTTESLSRSMGASINAVDNLNIVENIAKTFIFFKNATDNINISENVSLLKIYVKDPTNAYSSDGTYAQLIQAINGTLGVSVSIDGGVSYSNVLYQTFTSTEEYLSFGLGITELWGKTITGDGVDNTHLRIKLSYTSSAGVISQIYKNFGFSILAGTILTGLEVAVEAKYIVGDTSIYVDNLHVKIKYGTVTLPVQPGSQAYASDGRRAGQTAGNGTGVLCYYDSTNAWIACDSGAVVQA